MSTLTHNTVILTIPIYRDGDDDQLNYMTEKGDRVLPGDCYGPLVASGKPVCADVVIRIIANTDNDASVDGCTFTERDVLSIYFKIPGNPFYKIPGQAIRILPPAVYGDLAEFFRDEIKRAGT